MATYHVLCDHHFFRMASSLNRVFTHPEEGVGGEMFIHLGWIVLEVVQP